MAPLNKYSQLINSIWSFDDFLYLLQLHEYYGQYYLRDLPRFFWRRGLQRSGKLELTERAKLTKVVAVGIFLILLILAVLIAPASGWLLVLLIALTIDLLFIPVTVWLANWIIAPVYLLLRWRRISSARTSLLRKNSKAKIIAVAGSFGKTTVKNFVEQLIKHNYRVQVTPGTVNTPLGIAQWVEQEVAASSDVLVVEMDTYHPGEIRASCSITRPDIALITSIGDQHMMRFGSRHKLALSVAEVFTYAREQATKLIGAQDAEQLVELGIAQDTKELQVIEEGPLSYLGSEITTNLTQSVQLENLRLALAVAAELKIPVNFVIDACKKLEVPKRRKQLLDVAGFSVIDDSYNISPTTAQRAIQEAVMQAQQLKRELVVITAGIPETSALQSRANFDYGVLLAKDVHRVILLNSILSDEVMAGLVSQGYSNVERVERMAGAWEVIKQKFDPQQVLVLMQPELNDLYY